MPNDEPLTLAEALCPDVLNGTAYEVNEGDRAGTWRVVTSLAQARDDLVSLDADTATLEQNVSAEQHTPLITERGRLLLSILGHKVVIPAGVASAHKQHQAAGAGGRP